MQNFNYSIPTKVAFGEGTLENLPKFVKEYGKKVLIVYGGGSIKRTGLYDKVVALLKENDIAYEELSGVEPNPRVTTVEKGVAICREKGIDVVLPIGGGSTIDCAKGIAAAYYYDGPAWDIVLNNSLVTNALPIITILTLAATGSEMDYFAVISNEEEKEKLDINSDLIYPKYSILDPTLTYSVPAYQTASGTADMMSHIFEVYFNGVKDTFFQDRIMEALLKTCIKYGPIAVKEPDNYDARANLMWTSSWAINGFIACGKSGAWPCHAIEHQLSAYYDVTHGHGLAIITPYVMKYTLNDKTVDMYVTYGTNVFGIDPSLDRYEIANQAIEKTTQVFRDMGLKLTLRDIGITDKTYFEEMAVKAARGCEGSFVELTKDDIVKIFNQAF